MGRILFAPFRVETWLVLGFAAFLSEYLSDLTGPESQISYRERGDLPGGHALRDLAEFLLDPVWGPLVLGTAFLAVVVLLLMMWLGSRGKFVFLDGVARERAAIVEPWKRWSAQGDSLFLWWLVAGIGSLLVIAAVSLPVIPTILAAIANEDFQLLAFAGLLGWLAVLVPIVLAIAYVFLFTFQFVVPIMMIHGLGAGAAWGRFGALFRRHPWHFLAYGILYLVLNTLVGTVVAAFGLATCCVGFVILAIPYVGSVLLLPIEVTLRSLGPEFLAQFGPEYSVFAALPATPAPPPPPVAPPGPPA